MNDMKYVAFLVLTAFILASLILVWTILGTDVSCGEGWHAMPDGTCMSNTEKM